MGTGDGPAPLSFTRYRARGVNIHLAPIKTLSSLSFRAAAAAADGLWPFILSQPFVLDPLNGAGDLCSYLVANDDSLFFRMQISVIPISWLNCKSMPFSILSHACVGLRKFSSQSVKIYLARRTRDFSFGVFSPVPIHTQAHTHTRSALIAPVMYIAQTLRRRCPRDRNSRLLG